MSEKKLDVICLGAAVVDIPLRPVSRDMFDIESYPVDKIAMTVGGDAMNEATIISRLGFKAGSSLVLAMMLQVNSFFVLAKKTTLMLKVSRLILTLIHQ